MRRTVTALLSALVLSGTALAADVPSLVLKDHRFQPESIEVPAGQRVKLTIVNRDDTTEEFDSSDLHVEKMVPPGGTVSVFVGPLKPGTYEFVGELHEKTARGKLVAR